ncbi:MAG: hypothetical protein HY307_02225 [Arcobacter sp.]|nr:hypothetical protein [Arcobacter sp.]
MFDKFTTNLKFILPAKTATMLSNAMLMEDAPPLDTISEDVADAMKESVTQICGGLQTAINGFAYEDLGKTNFSIGDAEISNGNNYNTINTIVLFKLSVGEETFDYFIDIDDQMLEFLDELNGSEILNIDLANTKDVSSEFDGLDLETIEEKQEVKSLNIEDLDKNDIGDYISETSSENIKEDENISDSTDKTAETSEDEISPLELKNKKIKKIIIGLAVAILLVIITFLILLFTGAFDKAETPKHEAKIEHNITAKPTEESLIMADIKNKQIDFKLNMINEADLNSKLQMLTKYEILDEDILLKYKKDEEERLYKARMDQLEEFALNNKEESLFKKSNDENATISKSRFSDLTDSNTSEKISDANSSTKLEHELLMFVKINPKEYKKYKDIINSQKQIASQISMCKDNFGRVDVYFGPINQQATISDILIKANKINKNSKQYVSSITLSRGDFNKMCDF